LRDLFLQYATCHLLSKTRDNPSYAKKTKKANESSLLRRNALSAADACGGDSVAAAQAVQFVCEDDSRPEVN